MQGTSGLPIFVGAMAFAVKAVIDRVAAGATNEAGDTWIFNEPFESGTHLNDFRLVRPLFRDGKLFCWLASVGHWLDVGGGVPGGYNPKATEAYQEGVIIPPVKLVRAGVFQSDIWDIIAINTRLPQSNWGDLNGQLNALDLGERRMHALLDQYGDATVSAALDAFTARAEALMRAEIAALPDGTRVVRRFPRQRRHHRRAAAHRARPDDRGRSHDARFLALRAAVQGPLNISYATTVACCYVALKHIFPHVPANAGVLAPITFIVPPTTLLAAGAPRPDGRLHRDHPAGHRLHVRR